jgi:thiamine-monophosphate kinase
MAGSDGAFDPHWGCDYNGRARVGAPYRKSMTAARKPGEDVLLERIRRTLRGTGRNSSSLRTAMGDDAAVWQPRAGYETILTCDWFLEGRHFSADWHSPDLIAGKCLARAVSDIAAMGGEPRCFLLCLALPAQRTGDWLEKFLLALRATARAFNCPVAGGDTTRSEQILINISVVGECKRGRAIFRSGAKPGDAIFVSGRLGEAEYGLRLVQGGTKVARRDARLRKHLYPRPRLAAGLWLARRGLATAMMDLSDGLSTDLPRLCKASGVGARVEEKRLPCVQVADEDRKLALTATELALHGGDDYELLFTIAKKNLTSIPTAIQGLPITRIGEVIAGKKVVFVDESGFTEELKSLGWDPFR